MFFFAENMFLHTHDFWSGNSWFNPRRHRGGGGPDASPHEFLWNGRRTVGWIALKFCIDYGASFVQLWAKTICPRQVRSQSYDVISGTVSDRCFKEIVFSATWIAAINRSGDIRHHLGHDMTTSDLWHRSLTFKRSSEVTDLGWQHTYL